MREIKFRAWDKRAKQMYQVKNLGLGKESWLRTATNYGKHPKTGYNKFYPSEVEIMQYTGIKDKNGKEIYEGDILQQIHYKFSNDEYGHKGFKKTIIQVFWDSKMAGFVFKVIKKTDTEMPENYTEPYREVIGNIYDNPELLEKEGK